MQEYLITEKLTASVFFGTSLGEKNCSLGKSYKKCTQLSIDDRKAVKQYIILYIYIDKCMFMYIN